MIPLFKLLPMVVQKHDAASFPCDKKVALLEMLHLCNDSESVSFCKFVEMEAHSPDLCASGCWKQSDLVQDRFWTAT